MPYDGFVQGPLEGGIGIVKGVGSLTKGVVSGTFNTVSKITGSVASGIS
jgi:vacuolar protein sorting-associated protein 13A/C